MSKSIILSIATMCSTEFQSRVKTAFVAAAFAVLLSIVYSMPMNASGLEGIYVESFTVVKGDSVRFHISTNVTPFMMKVYRMGTTQKLVVSYSINGISGQTTRDSAYWYGCDWPANFGFAVPLDW